MEKTGKNDVSSSHPLVICTARYSDNLGDGVIGECLEYVIRKRNQTIDIAHLDIAGRNAYADDCFRKAHGYKKLFYKLPEFTRSYAVLLAWPFLMRPKLRRAWRRTVPEGPFNLVFGGGQIMSDVALNFPLKFHAIARFAKKRGALMAVNAVGVSRHWSVAARWLFGRSLRDNNVVSVSVRDAQSQTNLSNHLSITPRVTIDPGIFAGEHYGLIKHASVDASVDKDRPRRIGLGIAHPCELATQAENSDHFSVDPALKFWAEMASLVKSAGDIPVLYTNGAFEDEDFLKKVRDFTDRQIECLPRPKTPEELTKHIAGFDALISHRLHSNIVAYSLSVPAVSLVWDSKVRAFAKIAEREKWCLASDAHPEEIIVCLYEAIEHGVDGARLAVLKEKLEKDIGALLNAMQYT